METLTGMILIPWLCLCAWQDWKKREVANWLTLPPMLLALGLRMLGLTAGQASLLALIMVAVFIGWLGGWVGGADTKVTVALALVDPRLALWAWLGATAWYALLIAYARFIARDHDRIRLPGMLGFLIGAGGFWVWL